MPERVEECEALVGEHCCQDHGVDIDGRPPKASLRISNGVGAVPGVNGKRQAPCQTRTRRKARMQSGTLSPCHSWRPPFRLRMLQRVTGREVPAAPDGGTSEYRSSSRSPSWRTTRLLHETQVENTKVNEAMLCAGLNAREGLSRFTACGRSRRTFRHVTGNRSAPG